MVWTPGWGMANQVCVFFGAPKVSPGNPMFHLHRGLVLSESDLSAAPRSCADKQTTHQGELNCLQATFCAPQGEEDEAHPRSKDSFTEDVVVECSPEGRAGFRQIRDEASGTRRGLGRSVRCLGGKSPAGFRGMCSRWVVSAQIAKGSQKETFVSCATSLLGSPTSAGQLSLGNPRTQSGSRPKTL